MINDNLVASIVVFVVVQILTSVWWASRVNTILGILQKDLAELVSELKSMKQSYVSKANCVEYKTIVNQQIDALWKRVDQLKSKGE